MASALREKQKCRFDAKAEAPILCSGPERDTAWAMDERNAAMIDALRRTYEAFNRGDFDAAVESAHPEIEFIPPGRSTAAERRGGAAGVDGAGRLRGAAGRTP